MPRDASGNMTLPAGNPVVSNTDITTSWANPTMADLAAEIQDSLSRSGKGGMLVPFQNQDGTTTNPGITFTNQTGTGFSRSAAGLAVSFLGVLKALFAAALATFKTSVKVEGDLEVTGDLTLGGALSRSNLPALDEQISASSDTFSTTGAAFADVTDVTVNITSTGRPILLTLQNDDSSSASRIYVGVNGAATPTSVSAEIRLKRTGSSAAEFDYAISANGAASNALGIEIPPSAIQFLDVVAAGTYTYQLQVSCGTDSIVAVDYTKLIAYEL